MELALFLVSIALIVCLFYLCVFKRYDSMLYGTIVGKYKGNKNKGGYIVVEMDSDIIDDNGWRLQTTKVQGTYDVPAEYYDTVQLGDKGVFPK